LPREPILGESADAGEAEIPGTVEELTTRQAQQSLERQPRELRLSVAALHAEQLAYPRNNAAGRCRFLRHGDPLTHRLRAGLRASAGETFLGSHGLATRLSRAHPRASIGRSSTWNSCRVTSDELANGLTL